MKKIFALFLVAVMCVSLAACGGSKEAVNSKIEKSTEETKGETTEETTDNTVETESEVVVDNTPCNCCSRGSWNK